MKKFAVPALASLMLMAASFAWAADVNGTIKSIDPNTKQITLEDGKTFDLQTGVNAANLKAGDKVTITMEVQNGKNVATKVEKAG